MGIKNRMTEIKNSVDELHSRWNTADKRTGNLDYVSEDITENKAQKDKEMKNIKGIKRHIT